MSIFQPTAQFNLLEIQAAAEAILQAQPDPIPAYRLLREVLRLSPSDTRLRKAQAAADQSKWVKQLESAQHADGSWGRFHSQDTKERTLFRTTEEAIDRAFALGFEPHHAILTRVRLYIEKVLNGEASITDRYEKHKAWPMAIKLILAGRLSQLAPSSRLLEPYWSYLADVSAQAFNSGNYRLEDEVSAHLRLSGILWPEGFLESQHSLWILSSHPLPGQLEHVLMKWIAWKPDGIRYIRTPLAEPQPQRIGYWLRSINILSRFTSWREIFVDPLNKLWSQRDHQGLWDLDSRIARCVEFPLSESWRNNLKRKVDYSTHILVILRKFFD
ncbi:MAG TPA: hypothetical protein VLD65_02380 [Anaerolineales bacterium]|nr:hypothetical protein [Anaerolineales bacterium]